MSKTTYSQRTVWLFLTPHLALFCVFLVLPVLAVLALSFLDWGLLGNHHFAGFANYQEAFQDRRFWKAASNTAILSAVVVPVTIAAGFLLAVVLNRPIPGRSIFRAAIYLPTAISSVASAVVATWIFSDQYGVLNNLLEAMGLARVPWLSSTSFALTTVILNAIWLRVGICLVIYLAALQEIPRNLLDAAALDGAGPISRLRFVIWPSVQPTTTFLLVMNTIYCLHLFDLVYVMTRGGPASSSSVLVQYLYDAAFLDQREGYASAISVLLLLILLAVTSVLLVQRGGARGKTA